MRGLQEVKGESPKPSSRDQKKKTMKTNKQTKTNKKATAAQAGNTESVSELKNRTEQLSETETAKTSETETASEAPQETGTVNAPVKPYVNFAERDFNRKLSVERVLEKLERWMPDQFKLAEVVGKWIWISFLETGSVPHFACLLLRSRGTRCVGSGTARSLQQHICYPVRCHRGFLPQAQGDFHSAA